MFVLIELYSKEGSERLKSMNSEVGGEDTNEASEVFEEADRRGDQK